MALNLDQLGPWRVAFSVRLQKPFFYNTTTKCGQFSTPDSLIHYLDCSSQLISEFKREEPSEADVGALEEICDQQLASPTVEHSSNPPLAETMEPCLSLEQEEVVFTQFASSDPNVAASMDVDTSIPSSSQPLNAQDDVPPASGNICILSGDVSTASVADNLISPPQSSPLAASQWICDACTYINSSKRRPTCEMCESPNPSYVAIYNKPQRSQRTPNYNEGALFRSFSSQSSQPTSGQRSKRPRKSNT